MKRLMLTAVLCLPMSAAFAQTSDPHSGHGAPSVAATSSESPSTLAYKAQMDKMHEDMMAIAYSGNADIDFARGMIPHHQAAIDMAKTVLEHGKDPEIRKLAEEVVGAQESEIAQLQAWLKAHGGE